MNKNNVSAPTQKSGFTLVEVLVAMVIFGILIASAAYLMATVMWATQDNKDRLEATYLAQECVELMRNKRDTAWKRFKPWNCIDVPPASEFQAGDWYEIASGAAATGEICGPAANPTKKMHFGAHFVKLGSDPTGNSSGARLYQNAGEINYSPSPDPTIFQRWVTIDQVSDKQLDFTCHIAWERRSSNRSLSISSRLTNWYKP